MGNNKTLQKSVKRYLSKMKSNSRSLQRPQLQLSSLNNSMMMSTKSFLSNCKHPKTQSFALDETQERGGGSGKPRDDEAAAQLEDIDKFLFENFRSLYLRDVDVDVDHHVDNNHYVDDDNHYNKIENEEAKKKGKESKIIFDSPRSMDEFYLRRGSSSSSSSLVDELFRNSLTMSEEISGDPTTTPNNMVDRKEGKVLEGSIAVLTYSTNPYEDFKKSMEEMVEARKRAGDDGSIDWELMEEMLFCFIKLNDKKSYKYLINAFVDLVITLRAQTTTLQQLPAPPTAAPTTVMSVRRKKRPDYF